MVVVKMDKLVSLICPPLNCASVSLAENYYLCLQLVSSLKKKQITKY